MTREVIVLYITASISLDIRGPAVTKVKSKKANSNTRLTLVFW